MLYLFQKTKLYSTTLYYSRRRDLSGFII